MTMALAAAAWLAAPGSSALAAKLSEEPARVYYQVYLRAFFDGSAFPDQQGDLKGLEAKLDYLEELGVDTVLLMPVFDSTGGMGYTAKDYFKIDPGYGNEADLAHLVSAMHARDMKVLLDSPVNHVSWDSPWFLRGSQRNCDPDDSAHDPGDPNNVYCGFFDYVPDPCATLPYKNWHKPWQWWETDCTAVWFHRPEHNPAYHRPDFHYATFGRGMPDLKFYDHDRDAWNEPVVSRMQTFFDHYARLGVDGFRIDAAKHFVEGRANNSNPTEPKNLALLQGFLEGVRRVNPDVSFLGEIWAGWNEFEPYMPRSLDMVLDFPFMESARNAAGWRWGNDFKGVLKHFEDTQSRYAPGTRVVFAGNHDVNRMLTQWNDDEAKFRLAHFITLTTPFSPMIYYGEELGQHGIVKRATPQDPEEYVRTVYAFAWTGDPVTAGFPGGRTPLVGLSDNTERRNLVQARADQGSTWHMIRDVLRVRKDFGVTPGTRLKVRDDLFGHVIGWTMKNDRCLTALVNFHPQDGYEIEAKHAPAGCGTVSVERFAEGAERRERDGKVFYFLRPGAKVLFQD